jgi:hypothetical protein
LRGRALRVPLGGHGGILERGEPGRQFPLGFRPCRGLALGLAAEPVHDVSGVTLAGQCLALPLRARLVPLRALLGPDGLA